MQTPDGTCCTVRGRTVIFKTYKGDHEPGEACKGCIAYGVGDTDRELCTGLPDCTGGVWEPCKLNMAKIEAKKENFVDYLRTTLIPDLLESGRECTARDFETCCRLITNDHIVIEDCADDAATYCNEWKEW